MSVSKPGNPNDLTEVTASDPANPTSLTGVANQVLPRSIQPYINFDFANNVYEVNNEGTSLTDAVTYSRASSATFIDRYIDENDQYQYFLNTDFVGTVTNEALQTENLDNAVWTKGNVTLTANAERNPLNGLRNAYLMTNTATVESRIEDTLTLTASATVNFSVYVKSKTATWASMLIWDNSTNGGRQWFNIKQGYVGTGNGFGSMSFRGGKIEYIADGWYRISATIDLAATTSWTVRIQFSNANESTTSNQGEEYYIYAPQVTETEKVQPYVQTFNVAASKTFSATPRLEYDAATGESLGYLAERATTNLIIRSEEFDNVNWTKSGITVTANDEIAPDLTKSADKIEKTSGVNPYVESGFSATSGQTYAMTVFAKSNTTNTIFFYCRDTTSGNTFAQYFLLDDVAVGTATTAASATRIYDVGNGWVRCELVFTALNTTTYQVRVYPAGGDNDLTTVNGDAIYCWGAQVENLAYATSYIRTFGTTSRSADIMDASIPNIKVGSFDVEYNYLGSSQNLPGSRVTFELNTNGSTPKHILFNNSGSYGGYGVFIPANQVLLTGPAIISDQSFVKSAVTFETNNFSLYGNGALSNTDTSGVLPDVNQIDIGKEGSLFQLDGHIKNVKVWQYILTSDEVSKL